VLPKFHIQLKSGVLTNCVMLETGSVVFLLFGLTFIATVLYLPQHIVFLLNRAWFYVNGDSVDVLEMTKEAVQELAQGALHVAGTTGAGAAATAETFAKGEL
jgi:serine palmitoyltransferase small subunit